MTLQKCVGAAAGLLGSGVAVKNGSWLCVIKSRGTSLVAQMVKNLPAMQETWVQYLGWEDPLEEGMPTHYSCLENPHGQRSLAGYSLWGHKESDTTDRLSTTQHN